MDYDTREALARDLGQYIGMQVKMRRIEAGMTLDELAALIGVAKPTLSLLENGKTDFKISTLAALRSALALDVKVEPMGKIVG